MDKVTHRRFGNVRKLPSGRFQARWTDQDGTVHKAPDTFAKVEAAEAWLADRRAEVEASIRPPRPWTPRAGGRRFGNVRQLDSERWQARWTGPDGFVHKGPHTFASRDDAQAWLAAQEVARAEGRLIDDRDAAMMFDTIADQWKAESGWRRPSTLAQQYGYLDRYLIPEFGGHPVGSIDAAWVARFVAQLRARNLAAETIHKAVHLLGRILEVAIRDRRLVENPTRLVKLPSIERREMMVLDRDGIARLAAAMDPRYRALVIVGCYTGLRMGELTALTAADVDLLRRRITVRRNTVEVSGRLHHGQIKTAAGAFRVVPLSAEAVEALTPLVGGVAHRDDLVFTAPGGGYLRLAGWRTRFWGPATVAAGLDGFRAHDMRHTAVSLWCAAGIDPKTIATWAGHRSVTTVLDRYARYLPNNDDANLARLDAYIDTKRRIP